MVHVVNSFEMNNTHSLYEVEVSFSLILSNSFKVFNWDQLEYMPTKKQIKKEMKGDSTYFDEIVY